MALRVRKLGCLQPIYGFSISAPYGGVANRIPFFFCALAPFCVAHPLAPGGLGPEPEGFSPKSKTAF
jgi:hypothetical protein